MSQGSSLVIPIVLWGKEAPTHAITALAVSPDLDSIVTGGQEGQLIIWDVRQLTEAHRHSNVPSPMDVEEDGPAVGVTNEGNKSGAGGLLNSNDSGGLCEQPCWEVRAFIIACRIDKQTYLYNGS
jgi:WD40 repeat protein